MKSTRIPALLEQQIIRSLRENLHKTNTRLRRNYPEPQLSYLQRGKVAGSAWLERWQIRLNPVLLKENQQAFIEEVVPHELAHLLVWQYFSRVAPHGKQWKWMMESVLGVAARRTHQFATTSVSGQIFPYYCRCQQHYLTLRRHNRVTRGQICYRCLRCGDTLRAA